MEERETVNTSVLAVIGVVSVVLLFVIIVGLQALYYNFEESERTTGAYSRVSEEAARVRADQEAELNSYRWIDREKGVVGIPIDLAVRLTAREIEDASANVRKNSQKP